MSTSEPSLIALAEAILENLDPRLQPALRAEFHGRNQDSQTASSSKRAGARSFPVVLVGHRAAGKTRILPHIARFLSVTGVDLDEEIAKVSGRTVADWVQKDVAGFRRMEREIFSKLPKSSVIAVGGGFLSLHADLLEGCTPLLVPVSFETYKERLLADTTRPRLRADLTLDEEIALVFQERETLHQKTKTVSVAAFLLDILSSEPLR